MNMNKETLVNFLLSDSDNYYSEPEYRQTKKYISLSDRNGSGQRKR